MLFWGWGQVGGTPPVIGLVTSHAATVLTGSLAEMGWAFLHGAVSWTYESSIALSDRWLRWCHSGAVLAVVVTAASAVIKVNSIVERFD